MVFKARVLGWAWVTPFAARLQRALLVPKLIIGQSSPFALVGLYIAVGTIVCMSERHVADRVQLPDAGQLTPHLER